METLGNEALATVRLGSRPDEKDAPLIVARVETRRTIEPGAAVHCIFDRERIHLFDATSGLSLRPEGVRP